MVRYEPELYIVDTPKGVRLAWLLPDTDAFKCLGEISVALLTDRQLVIAQQRPAVHVASGALYHRTS